MKNKSIKVSEFNKFELVLEKFLIELKRLNVKLGSLEKDISILFSTLERKGFISKDDLACSKQISPGYKVGESVYSFYDLYGKDGENK